MRAHLRVRTHWLNWIRSLKRQKLFVHAVGFVVVVLVLTEDAAIAESAEGNADRRRERDRRTRNDPLGDDDRLRATAAYEVRSIGDRQRHGLVAFDKAITD